MSAPYRESGAPTRIGCARCGKPLPPGDLAVCVAGCGVWVALAIASEALEADELRPSRIPTWARVRVGCPVCGTQMTLRGHDMTLFQGCDDHGFWIDGPTVTQTGLGRPALAARLASARSRATAIVEEEQRLERAVREAANLREREREAARERVRQQAQAAEEQHRRDAAEREASLRPFLDTVELAFRLGQQRPLAELLQRLEGAVAELRARVVELERRGES